MIIKCIINSIRKRELLLYFTQQKVASAQLYTIINSKGQYTIIAPHDSFHNAVSVGTGQSGASFVSTWRSFDAEHTKLLESETFKVWKGFWGQLNKCVNPSKHGKHSVSCQQSVRESLFQNQIAGFACVLIKAIDEVLP